MKNISFSSVTLTSGYLFDKQELNRKTTIQAVYDRFSDTGRIRAFDFAYVEGVSDPAQKPHIFWDSDVAKWMEGAAYILKKHPTPALEAKIDALVEKIRKHQCEDGYFNIYFTVIDPKGRFAGRANHELYCAGHLMEAAIAYADATGKREFLDCMEKYADYINKVFLVEKSAAFSTPGHQEIELALIKMYRFTGKKKYLDMAEYFIRARGRSVENDDYYNQSHLPVEEQTEAVGHSVRAMYLYTGMAMLAEETGDVALFRVCKTLWEDTVFRKMYVTGGLGSTNIGEAFTSAFDLPNDTAYAETCAGIGLMLFSQAMLAHENHARYADAIERVLYNGVLSGLSLDGTAFFYENPLEINRSEQFQTIHGNRRLPITQRVACFSCSCCPPNVNRLLPALGSYLYGVDGETLFVNQFVSSTLDADGMTCTQETTYPNGNTVHIRAAGAKKIAVRIPAWCESFTINREYTMSNGYAVIENDGEAIEVAFDMTPRTVFADPRVIRDANRLCVMRGPIVYCAEGIDNGENLHRFVLPVNMEAKTVFDETFGLYTLEIPCLKRIEFAENELYSSRPPKTEKTTIKLIPYHCFANRGESDMLVWLCGDYS
ncbi:MAG: glycoside hydrolase family 127 protein [Ruminococcaceae bacterium]|nr:glycoside hydrolase family 127 protein [Oscillospiraceae bacterium]